MGELSTTGIKTAVYSGEALVETSEQKYIDEHWKYENKPIFDFFKRTGDIICSLLAILVLFVPLLIVALIIVIDDFGNPIYSHVRIGRNGKPFKMYKFRSMYTDADERRSELLEKNESDGATFKIKNDPRVTRIGRFLRKTSIDELPQLINILKGDMSVIGPRPFIPEEQQNLPEDRLLVRPGLSCYWQVGGKNSLTVEESNALDRKYIENRSILVDINIILLTIKLILSGKNS